ncbi:LOW QUALITY PROTEIN: phosphoglycerate mutase family 2 [Bacillus sp. JCM 19045]|nr:LOW QUALITY PROTEIN: phosphoglycerate mutase family 2 [Bacillus sp. JCM 19045]
MTIIYLVRHAESPHLFGQERTRGLTEAGWTATKAVTKCLEEEQIDAVVSSAYTRAVQTVEGIAVKKGPVQTYEGLIERPIKGLDYKLPEQELFDAIERSFADPDYCLPGGETMREAQDRSIPIMRELLSNYKDGTIVLGTHGTIMTVILHYFDSNYAFDFWKSTTKPDIYKLTFKEEQLVDVSRVWEASEQTKFVR